MYIVLFTVPCTPCCVRYHVHCVIYSTMYTVLLTVPCTLCCLQYHVHCVVDIQCTIVTKTFLSCIVIQHICTRLAVCVRYNVLEITDGVEQPGYIRWQLLLCLLAAWMVVFLSLIKGIKSSGLVSRPIRLK